MSPWLGAAILVAGFVSFIQLLGLVKKSNEVILLARRSLEIIRSSMQSNDEKEKALQRNSLKLFGLFLFIALGGAVAVLLPIGLLWLCDYIGWLSLSAVLDTALSPAFIIMSSLLMVFAFIRNHHKSSSTAVETNRYSRLDRILHQVAFKTNTAQIALADVEDAFFAKELARCQTTRPVFITALPRAGTTLLLECCAGLPEFAAHCYRDMPFVLIPCLWNRFSKSFQRPVESHERAHGDGMPINPDSPEALEEVIWKNFWQQHYHKDRIVPWDREENEEFDEFFRSHMRKIILLRSTAIAPSVRYLSKNNANIARTRVLSKLFPDSTILVPFRDPLQHAASLRKQHLNFLRIHEMDSFASEYMKAIGHFDFGQNLRPIDFDGWYDKRQSRNADSLAFWLEYWAASYKYLLSINDHNLYFISYEGLCASPENGFRTIAEVLEIRDPEALLVHASRLNPPKQLPIDAEALPELLLKEVQCTLAHLHENALN